MIAEFVKQAVHSLSRSDRAAKLAALSTRSYPQDGVKRARLNTLDPGRHSQPCGYYGNHSQQ